MTYWMVFFFWLNFYLFIFKKFYLICLTENLTTSTPYSVTFSDIATEQIDNLQDSEYKTPGFLFVLMVMVLTYHRPACT